MSGYARAIGHTTSVAAELWPLRDGINLCIELNLAKLLVELDVKLVIDLLMKDEGKSNSNDIIIADCKDGLQKILRVESSIAAIGKQISVLMLLLEEAPYFLKILLFFVST